MFEEWTVGFLVLLSWAFLWGYVLLRVRVPESLPRATPPCGTGETESRPLVSVVVPARNEEDSIGACVESLLSQDYGRLEVLVVDDRSEDGTVEVLEGLGERGAPPLRIVRGEPLPPGWLGKPWACWQGAARARGELLLFTDADTLHDPDLLRGSVHALLTEGGDALTLIGKQVMESFWERLLQPPFFMLLGLRYPRAGELRPRHGWRGAIANGQYLLFRRASYETLGGHRAVRGEVVEDLRLAQLLVKNGMSLLVRSTRGLRTRMYRSLGGLVSGWAKNVAIGARQASPPWVRPLAIPSFFVGGVLLWVLPLPMLIAGLRGEGGHAVLLGGVFGVMSGFLFWAGTLRLMGERPWIALFYPLGVGVAGGVVLASWVRGRRVRWKGRRYLVEVTGDAESSQRKEGEAVRKGGRGREGGRGIFTGDGRD